MKRSDVIWKNNEPQPFDLDAVQEANIIISSIQPRRLPPTGLPIKASSPFREDLMRKRMNRSPIRLLDPAQMSVKLNEQKRCKSVIGKSGSKSPHR
jgi:hypothetical protein